MDSGTDDQTCETRQGTTGETPVAEPSPKPIDPQIEREIAREVAAGLRAIAAEEAAGQQQATQALATRQAEQQAASQEGQQPIQQPVQSPVQPQVPVVSTTQPTEQPAQPQVAQQPAGQAAPTSQMPSTGQSYVPQYPSGGSHFAQAQQAAVQQPASAERTYSYVAPRPTVETSQPRASRTRRKRIGLRAFAFGLLGGLLGAAAMVGILTWAGVIRGEAQAPVQTSAPAQTIQITSDSEDVTVAQAVAAKVLPSVVLVECTYSDGSGLGSGVILDSEGDIITNYHVIEGANTITVTVGGRSFDAEVVGSDASSDLAVIKAGLEDYAVTPIEVGDSSALTVGDWVMTVGNPFGLDQSVSAGIVSSLSRNELMESDSGTTIYANLIQVDAAINPGNSGGALVNSNGQLVGICTLFSSDTESFAGIGFAIPGNYAIDIANRIIAGEPVTHAYIGLSMQTVNEQNAEANGLSVSYGAYVAELLEGGPAEAAGIEVGDIVIAFDGKRVTSADSMVLEVRSHSTGETVTVTVMRGEERLDIEVTLGSDEYLQELQAQEREQQRERERQDEKPFAPFGVPDGGN